jgi:phage replication O-like protein O
MADVQPEDGYTALAHPVIEALARAPMPGRHLRVVLVVARLTWGWRKKSDRIGSRQIAGLCGLDPSHVRKILQDLLRWKVVKETARPYRGRREIGLEKDFELWRIASTTEGKRVRKWAEEGVGPPTPNSRRAALRPGVGPPTREGVGPPAEEGVGPPYSKERKESVRKEKPLSDPSPSMLDAMRLAELLRDEIQRTEPKAKVPFDRELGRWTRELERMIRIDSRDPGEVEGAIRWLFGPNLQSEASFVVLSAEALRKKFDRVVVQMRRGPRGRRSASDGWRRDG